MSSHNDVLLQQLFQNIHDVFNEYENFNVKRLNNVLTYTTQRWGNKDKDLLNVISSAIRSIVEHCDIQSNNYLKQIGKVTENSNMAIRNVVQNEQYQCLATLNKMRQSCQDEKEKYFQSQKDKIDEYEYQINHLQRECQRLEHELHDSQFKANQQDNERHEAIDKALIEQKNLFQSEKNEWIRRFEEDKTVLRESIAERHSQSLHQLKAHFETIKVQEEAIRYNLQNEKTIIKSEYESILKEYQLLKSDYEIQKERHSNQLLNDKEKYERDIMELNSNHLQYQSKLQQQYVTKLEAIKAQEKMHLKELQHTYHLEKENLMDSHLQESDSLANQLKREFNQQKSRIEYKFQDDYSKAQKLHEQELGRLIRENDRLRKLCIRYGILNETTSMNQSSSSSSFIDHPSSSSSSSFSTSPRHSTLSPSRQRHNDQVTYSEGRYQDESRRKNMSKVQRQSSSSSSSSSSSLLQSPSVTMKQHQQQKYENPYFMSPDEKENDDDDEEELEHTRTSISFDATNTDDDNNIQSHNNNINNNNRISNTSNNDNNNNSNSSNSSRWGQLDRSVELQHQQHGGRGGGGGVSVDGHKMSSSIKALLSSTQSIANTSTTTLQNTMNSNNNNNNTTSNSRLMQVPQTFLLDESVARSDQIERELLQQQQQQQNDSLNRNNNSSSTGTSTTSSRSSTVMNMPISPNTALLSENAERVIQYATELESYLGSGYLM